MRPSDFQIGSERPELLVAHAYTRYLGDLSGGQVLGKITQKSLGLSGREGLSFFSFPRVSSANRFKQLYRGRMNSVELTESQRSAVLREAEDAFQLNIQVRCGETLSLSKRLLLWLLEGNTKRKQLFWESCTVSARKWRLKLSSSTGFWWPAENADHYWRKQHTEREQRCQSLPAAFITHHAVHLWTVCCTDHCWDGNVRLVETAKVSLWSLCKCHCTAIRYSDQWGF